MLLTAEPDETYCLRTQRHESVMRGNRRICYRCGMILGDARAPELGSLLDY